MLSAEQIKRMCHEKDQLVAFINSNENLTLGRTVGSPPHSYQIRFQNVHTTVSQDMPEPTMSAARVDIRPVTFELAVTLEESYPLQQPGLAVSPARDQNGALWFLYNSHIFLFALCLFSRWRMHYSLVDIVCRTYNILTYNHNLVNLDRTDVLNPAALAWYKEQLHRHPAMFPLAPAMLNVTPSPNTDRRRFHFTDMVQEA